MLNSIRKHIFQPISNDVLFVPDSEVKDYKFWLVKKLEQGKHIFASRCSGGRILVAAYNDKVANLLLKSFVAKNVNILPQLNGCNRLEIKKLSNF